MELSGIPLSLNKTNRMNKKIKPIEAILPPPPFHMVGDGFRVHGFFPAYGLQRMSPFFLLDYNAEYYFPPREQPRGVGAHPHRGLETVTIAFQGKIAHRDSVGNHGVIAEGDVQWMTAGSGILHNEFHEQEFSRRGGNLQMVQLWVNLPAKHKMTPPHYQGIENQDMGKYVFDNKMGKADIISGTFRGVKGSAHSFTPVELYMINLQEHAKIDITLPGFFNTGLLMIKGTGKVNETSEAPADHFVLFKNEGELVIMEAMNDCTLVVMSGEPIHEPIAPHGPFLMNTRDEIRQAYEDFYSGKFGTLED
jgi:redox-sensitive bicupin YhaK (pirin superfamily)